MKLLHALSIIVPFVLSPTLARATNERLACATASEEGQKLRDEGKLLQAQKDFLTCARDVCPATIRKDCGDWLAKAEASTPTLVFSAKDTSGHDLASVKVAIDGAPLTEKLDGKAIAVDPGQHTFRFEVSGENPIEQRLVVREGEKNRAVPASWEKSETARGNPVTGVVEPTPIVERPSHVPAIVVGALAIASLGVGATFAIIGTTGYNDLQNGCGKTTSCSESQVSPVKTELLVADIGFGVGIAAFVTAVILFVTESPSKPHSHVTGFDFAPTPGGGALRFGGTF